MAEEPRPIESAQLRRRRNVSAPGQSTCIAWGYSQTGGFLYTYVNAIHPLDMQANGKPIFDAYLIAMASGPQPSTNARRRFRLRAIRAVRSGTSAFPSMRVMSRSDYLRGMAARRPDSDTAPDQYAKLRDRGRGATPRPTN